MTKSKNTKRALLMSILSMMLCIAMLAGSTFAWFTDTVTSGKNRIVAGNLDVELYHTNVKVKDEKVSADTKLFVNKDGSAIQWEPGVMIYENFTVKNVGSLSLKYKLTLNAEFNTVDGKSLKDVLKVAILDEAFSGDRVAAKALISDKAIADFETIEDFEKTGNLIAGNPEKVSDTYAVLIYWEPSDKDNDYNFNNERKDLDRLYVALGVNLIATQAVSESDSFGEDYDEKADYNGQQITADKVTAPVNLNTKLIGENITVIVPQEAAGGDTLSLTMEQIDTPEYIPVDSEKGEESRAYDISVKGLKENNDKPIKVVLSVGKDITDVKLYHGSTLIDCEHDPAAGTITFETTSFSPFTVVYKPAISNTEELIAALAEAKPGDEVVISDGNYDMPEEYTIAEGVTITGTPGAVLNVSGGENGITQGLLLKNDNITISGVTIQGDFQKSTAGSHTEYNACVRITGNNVTLDNVTIDSQTNDSPIVIASTKSDDNTITIKNCNLTAAFKAIHIVDGTKGTVNIENCNIDAVYTFNSNTNSVYKLSVKNSVLNGWTSYGTSVTSVEFDKCVFGMGHGQKTIAAYTDTVFNNCSFSDTQILAVRGKPGFKIEFTNCKYSEVDVTPDNIKTTITSDSDIWNYSTCIVNGTTIPKD